MPLPCQLRPANCEEALPMTWLIALSIGFAADTLIGICLALLVHPDWISEP